MNSLLKGTWTKRNPLLSGQRLVPKVFCKKDYKTAFHEGKLSKAETEIKDNVLTESILHVVIYSPHFTFSKCEPCHYLQSFDSEI